ncbi:Transforming growth factor beta receptor type 3 [Clarias magur]|uniref:Transforming growth factor beta receptor type 3 n=1 Tax=Clarias magur TaxID=1594786 RepID=A0A8J4XA29_CLAMG|nr:Transforming growth factor beta receptor type 3 [Clarias magur]
MPAPRLRQFDKRRFLSSPSKTPHYDRGFQAGHDDSPRPRHPVCPSSSHQPRPGAPEGEKVGPDDAL